MLDPQWLAQMTPLAILPSGLYRRDAQPALNSQAAKPVDGYHRVGDSWPVRRQTCRYLPSQTVLPLTLAITHRVTVT